ncbi:MAG: hypothetical protein CYPHOPRED_002100 [Cyphobasidiales sp. Tagirdzhanova-0007]|nr:MAG: hypothetical protein CYPHOPRED_002100 [Cyphobasidiales sp. Tagirdzhanova-0007]
MSGYGPLGWSYSLNFSRALQRGPQHLRKTDRRVGGRGGVVVLGALILRLALGVHQGLVFELLGAFILSQTGYKGYDFQTHHEAHAIVFIGSTGGIAMGIMLLLLDVITIGARPLADVEPETGRGPKLPADIERVPHLAAHRNQAVLRTILWPFLAAGSGVVGVMLYQLSVHNRARPDAGERAGTAATVQVVGAAIAVSAPSLLQLLTLIGGGNGR